MVAAPSAEARSVADDLLFDDVADLAATLAALAINLAAAAERRDLISAQGCLGFLRLASIAIGDDLDRLDGREPQR